MTVVLDASAVLAYLRDEPGASVVADALAAWAGDEEAAVLVSTVNWIEIAQRVEETAILADLESVVEIVPFSLRAAVIAAGLSASTQAFGLSLADRACLAVATECGLPVLTADREWSRAQLDVEVRQIR